jgi:hypothetical protein
MKVKDEFVLRGCFEIGNDLKTKFWEETWLGNTALVMQLPSLQYYSSKGYSSKYRI